MGILRTAPPGADEATALYQWLTDRQGRRNVFDAHLFARILARRWTAGSGAGAGAVGLSDRALTRLLEHYFPDARTDGLPVPNFSPAPLPALLRDEVADLTDLLLAHRSLGVEEEEWLAAMIARAALDDGELWQALGLTSPRQLSALMERHFAPLAPLSPTGKGWTEILYRILCARDGLIPCGTPACRDCGADAVCFGSGD